MTVEQPEWVESVMAVVADVDWADLSHAYGSAEQTPIALRAWLSSDDRARAEIDVDDEVFPIIVDYGGATVARAALGWIFVSVFHQGSLYSASAPVCRVMVAALELSPVEGVRTDALQVLDYSLTMGDHRRDWRAAGFDATQFRSPEVLVEVEQGFTHYTSAIGAEQSEAARKSGTRILPWMPDRLAAATAIIDVLAEERDDDEQLLEAAASDEIIGLQLRALGLVASDTAVQDMAETGIRSFLDEPGAIGLAACIALARLRRVDENDAPVIARLQAEFKSQGAGSDMRTVLLDALVTIALHCAPAWDPDADSHAAARRIGDDFLQSLDAGDDISSWAQRHDASTMIQSVLHHHGLL